MKIVEKEFNALTGEETITEREATSAEIKAREDAISELNRLEIEAEAKATAKADV